MIIGLSGKARNGKDEAVRIAQRHFGDCIGRVAFADAVREEALAAGAWDGETPYTPAGRTALQAYGMSKRAEDPLYWVRRAFERIDASPGPVVWLIPDTRFRNEAASIMAKGGEVWRLYRVTPDGRLFDNGLTADQKVHPSETNLDVWTFKRRIVASNLESLEAQVVQALMQLGL